jgi:hypothetical protein
MVAITYPDHMRSASGLFAIAIGLGAGCATSSMSSAAMPMSPPPRPLQLESIATPRTPQDAGRIIGEVGERLRVDDRAGVIARVVAMLRSDFLTDHGRANLYWLLADASVGFDDDLQSDALGGYLVAATLLPPDPDVATRVRKARGALLALKVQRQALGLTPAQAIRVPSHTDADLVVAALSCGNDGGRYVERRLPGTFRGDALEPRRLLCSENGDELTLWFRVDSDGM